MRERTLPLVGGFLSNLGYDRHNCALTKKHLVPDYETKCFFSETKLTSMRAVSRFASKLGKGRVSILLGESSSLILSEVGLGIADCGLRIVYSAFGIPHSPIPQYAHNGITNRSPSAISYKVPLL